MIHYDEVPMIPNHITDYTLISLMISFNHQIPNLLMIVYYFIEYLNLILPLTSHKLLYFIKSFLTCSTNSHILASLPLWQYGFC
jgi:hypothetical protein